MKAPRFDLGRVVATPGALEALILVRDSPATFLARHAVGDWGDLDEDDLHRESPARAAARVRQFAMIKELLTAATLGTS